MCLKMPLKTVITVLMLDADIIHNSYDCIDEINRKFKLKHDYVYHPEEEIIKNSSSKDFRAKYKKEEDEFIQKYI
jgi:hypothetical protein